MKLTARLIVFACLATATLPAAGQLFWERRAPYLDLVYYSKDHEPISKHLARSFENSLAFDRKLFNWTPSQPVVILLEDFSDFGHGGTSTVPFNFMSIGIEPFDYVYDLAPANERVNWLMHHELVHVVSTDKGADRDLAWRKFFRGKVAPTREEPISMYYSFLTSPRWYSPRWYLEGIAVFLETWMSGGLGRTLGGYDEMVFRSMCLDNDYFYDVVGLESEGTTADFQVGENSYLYGARFMSYLADKYGPAKLIQWVDRSPGSRRYFSSQFRKVYGTNLDTEWRNWIAAEHEFQRANLELIRKYPVTPQTPLVHEALGSVSRSYYDAERHLLYAGINRPAKPPQIVSIDTVTGAVKPLTEIFGGALYYPTSLAFDPAGRKLFFTTNNSRGWRDLNELDLQSGRTRVLIQHGRIGDLAVDTADQSLWGVRHSNGFSSLVRIAKPYADAQTVMDLEYGRDLFDIDISPDGTKLTGSMIDVSGAQQLVAFDVARLMAGDTHFEVLHVFPDNSPSNFVFSPDGRYLYGTSYYTGASNVFRYSFETKKMDALTNVETGLFRPIPISDTSMIAYRYTSKGLLPVTVPVKPIEDISALKYLGQQIVDKYPVVKEWNAGSPARVDLEKITTWAGAYRQRDLGLGSVYPVVEGYKNNVAAGLRFNVADPFQLNALEVTAAVTAGNSLKSSERFHAKAVLDHYPWNAKITFNPTDFYDLFGPTKVSRKGYSGVLSRHDVISAERPRTLEYTVTGAYYGGLDTLPEYQNVKAPFSRYATLGGHLDFKDLRKTLGAVDDDRGVQWTLAARADHAQSKVFPRMYATYDRGFLLPMERTSLWVRTAAGKSWGDRENPFANFYFGGFGNNYVDYQEVHRYAEYYSFPGVELDEIGGNSFGKATLELQLPPVKFRRVGMPGLYARWARLSLFTEGLETNPLRSDLRRELISTGAQVDLSIVMFSWLDSTLSAGYAVATEHGKRSNEVMVSLKLLH